LLGQEPTLRIMVKDGTYESLSQLLRGADIDFIVGPLRGTEVASDFVEETLYDDRFVAVVRRGHPLAGNGQGASLRGLAPFPWIGPLPGTPAHAVFERLFLQAGVESPVVALRAHSTAVVRSVLLAGDHVALISPLQVQAEVRSGLLVCVTGPLTGSERAIGITQRRDALESTACRKALVALRQVTADALASLVS
jgi:LysR family transcriptional regulator, regulator for genes of the gallate degradation pathway